MSTAFPAKSKVSLEEVSAQLTEVISRNEGLVAQNGFLQENLAAAQAMLSREDVSWLKLFGGSDDEGLSLEDLKSWSDQIQNARVGNPHIKHGLMLRHSYILKGGIQYTFPKPKQGQVNVRERIDTVSNQRNFFGRSAYRKRETALFNCGLYVAFGDNSSKELEPIPIAGITDYARHPFRRAEVIAYRHTYEEFNESNGETKTKNEWVYVDHYTGQRKTAIQKKGGEAEKVRLDLTAFDLIANGVDDYALGAPDALAALVWSRLVRDLTMNGITMSNALATFAFKASTATKKGGENVALALASSQTPGSTASVGGVNDLVPMSSAGKGYDFDSYRFVVATAAAALDLSVIAFSSDPGTAGSSYGSAQTLDMPTRLAMESRRDEHVEFDTRVLRWMGARDFDVWFHPYDDATELLRNLQAEVIRWGMGLYGAEEMKARIEGKDVSEVTVPDGVLLPNNKASWERADIDPKDAPGTGTSSTTQTTPGQGQATGAGRRPPAGDMRSDAITEALAIVDRIDKMIESFGEQQVTANATFESVLREILEDKRAA